MTNSKPGVGKHQVRRTEIGDIQDSALVLVQVTRCRPVDADGMTTVRCGDQLPVYGGSCATPNAWCFVQDSRMCVLYLLQRNRNTRRFRQPLDFVQNAGVHGGCCRKPCRFQIGVVQTGFILPCRQIVRDKCVYLLRHQLPVVIAHIVGCSIGHNNG